MTHEIRFFKLRDPFGFCSNFYRVPILLYGRTWQTSEHAFQSRKFTDPLLQERVWRAVTPKQSAEIGRDRSLPLRPDWESPDPSPEGLAIRRVKDRFMFDIVLAKFEQHPDLTEKLLEGDGRWAHFVENTSSTGDAYWGETSPGVGENRLGHIIDAVRDRLR